MIPDRFLTQPSHRELVDELLALDTAEDRLSWLMERPPLHKPIPQDDRVEEKKVPGCLSGLWLHAEMVESTCFFSAYSDSDLVHGVVSFLCDLYSDRDCSEVLEVGDLLARSLRIEGLLSTNRKRAVSSALSFFQHTARATCSLTETQEHSHE